MFQYKKVDSIAPSYYDDVLVKSKNGDIGFLKPKKKSIQHKCGKKELTATIQISRQLTTLWNRYAFFIVGAVSDGMGGEYEEETVYDALDAAARFDMEVSENADEDYYEIFGRVPRGTKRMAASEVKHRVLLFVKLCNACASDDVLKYIVENAPKKANGTFTKNRITRIATLCCLNFSSEVFELVGIAKSDTEIEIKVREVGFNHKSMELIETDIVSKTDLFKNLSNEDDDDDDEMESMKVEFRMGDISIHVPVLPLENGELAIDAKPYRAISSFPFVKKCDDRYLITTPEPEDFIVEHREKSIEVAYSEYNTPKIKKCWEFLSAAVKIVDTPSKTGKLLKDIEKIERELRGVSFSKEERKILYRSEQLISEAVYLMLCSFEYLINDHNAKVAKLVQNAIDNNDLSNKYLMSTNYHACSNLRKIRAFDLYITLFLRKGNLGRVEVIINTSISPDWTLN